MYVNSHLSENTVLAYADPEFYFPGLHQYYCLDCNFEFQSADAERCPSCGSDEVQKER